MSNNNVDLNSLWNCLTHTLLNKVCVRFYLPLYKEAPRFSLKFLRRNK